MTEKDTKLTAKQQAFCHQYLIDLNATQAAKRAGYSAHSATRQAHRLMNDPAVQTCIEELKTERNNRLSISADYVLQQAVQLHERCMQQVQPKVVRSKELSDSQGNPIYEFDASNALKALELIGKHVSVAAFKDRLEVGADLNASFVIAPIGTTDSVNLASAETEIET